MAIKVYDVMQRIERQAENPASKVHQADDGSYSWPIFDDGSAILRPQGFSDDYPEVGMLTTVVEDDGLKRVSLYLYNNLGLVQRAGVLLTADVNDPSEIHASLVESMNNDPTCGTPNSDDYNTFSKVLLYP